jgi:hypothetical protein
VPPFVKNAWVCVCVCVCVWARARARARAVLCGSNLICLNLCLRALLAIGLFFLHFFVV